MSRTTAAPAKAAATAEPPAAAALATAAAGPGSAALLLATFAGGAGARAVQAKLEVGAPDDEHEREADRVAARVTSDPPGGAPPLSPLTRSATVARRARRVDEGSAEVREATTPQEVHGPGDALPGTVRAYFEPRLERDLGGVRVHRGAEAEASAHSLGARAYTVGRDVVFGAGQYAPDTPDGRRLMAHELAHVAQQGHAPPLGGRGADSVREAPLRAQRRTVTVRGRAFTVGDAILSNALARTDVMQRGVLLPGPDQAHIMVTGAGELGYEISYTTPDDPFRWGMLKEIVDNGHVEIRAIGMADSFQALEVTGTTQRTATRNLMALGASGITMPRLAVQRAINPAGTGFVASTSSARDQVYYESQAATGRGLLGNNSLAHELFGHLWLSMHGVSWQHGGTIAAAGGVMDPMGRPFTGSVNDFISKFAAASSTALQSPTQGVSVARMNAALAWILANGAAGLTLNGTIGSMTSAVATQWEILSGNYDILRANPPPPPPAPAPAVTPTPAPGGTGGTTGTPAPAPAPAAPAVPTPASIVAAIVTWATGTLTADQRTALRSVLVGITTSFGSNRRTNLPNDVVAQLPRPSP